MKKVFYVIPYTVFVLVGAENIFANDAHDMLSKYSNKERNALLGKFLQQNNEKCGTVVKNFFQGFDENKNAYWNVACQNKSAYVIQFQNDKEGSTSIMDCGMVKFIAGVECFKKLEK